MRKYLKEILVLLGPDRRRLPKLILLFLSVSLLDLAGIGLIGPYIAIVSNPQSATSVIEKVNSWINFPLDEGSLLILISSMLLIIFFIKTVSAIWINFTLVSFSVDQQIRLRKYLMKSYQALPYEVYIERNSSEYIHSTQTLVNKYSTGVILSGLRTLSDSIVAVAILILLAWTNLYAFLLLAGLMVLIIFSYDRIFRKNLSFIGRQTNIASNNMLQGVSEALEGLKEIRIFGCENYFYNKVKNSAKIFGVNDVRSSVISSAPRYILEFIMVLFIVLLVIVTLNFEENSQQLLPTLAVFGLATVRLLPAMTAFSGNLIQLRVNRDSVSLLYKDIKEMQSNKYIAKGSVVKDSEFKILSMNNVSFHYSASKKNALNQITLDLKAGESIGFIGSSGSGKTTLIDIMLGLLKPQHGSVSFNGSRLSEEIEDWHHHVAYIPQQIFLIDNSLKCNVALGVESEDIDEEKLINSLKKARLFDLMQQLPEGVDTVIGERGVKLSGGQRQRIALARAFYHERDVLIMDEATSALDNNTEREIVDEIKYLKGKITVIIIAHRLTTVQHCDRIYKIENTRIINSGTPKEILL